jgi:hypothetical protein
MESSDRWRTIRLRDLRQGDRVQIENRAYMIRYLSPQGAYLKNEDVINLHPEYHSERRYYLTRANPARRMTLVGPRSQRLISASDIRIDSKYHPIESRTDRFTFTRIAHNGIKTYLSHIYSGFHHRVGWTTNPLLARLFIQSEFAYIMATDQISQYGMDFEKLCESDLLVIQTILS